jgi:hypothetical protein
MCAGIPSNHEVACQHCLLFIKQLADLGLFKGFRVVCGPAFEAVSSDLNEHLILFENPFAVYDPDECSRVRDDNPGLFLEALVHTELHAVNYRGDHRLLFDLKLGQGGILQHALELLAQAESL